MKVISRYFFAVCASSLILFGTAYAQDGRDDGTDVWIAVEAQWDAEENGDKKWIDRMLAENFFGQGWTNLDYRISAFLSDPGRYRHRIHPLRLRGPGSGPRATPAPRARIWL